MLLGFPWLPVYYSGPGMQKRFDAEFYAVLLIILPVPPPPLFFFFFQKKKQDRITFDTMDFVAESVCMVLTLMLGIFFQHHGLEEALGWASEPGFSPGSVTSAVCHLELAT